MINGPKISTSEIDGWIIAGGASTRIGCDKAALRLDGLTLIERAGGAISEASEGRIHIAGDARSLAPQWPAFPDSTPGKGPLTGLATALANGSSRWIAVISCDMPFVTGDVFERLARLADPLVAAVVPLQFDERPQPLCALYRRQIVHPIVKELIESSDRSMHNLLSQLSAQYLSFSAFCHLPNAEHLFFNINSNADYERAKDIAQNFNF